MKKELELLLGLAFSALTWGVTHFDKLLAAAVGLTALFVWLMKARREWRDRNRHLGRRDEEE